MGDMNARTGRKIRDKIFRNLYNSNKNETVSIRVNSVLSSTVTSLILFYISIFFVC